MHPFWRATSGCSARAGTWTKRSIWPVRFVRLFRARGDMENRIKGCQLDLSASHDLRHSTLTALIGWWRQISRLWSPAPKGRWIVSGYSR